MHTNSPLVFRRSHSTLLALLVIDVFDNIRQSIEEKKYTISNLDLTKALDTVDYEIFTN